MFRKTVFLGLVVAALVAVFHFLAVTYHLYWRIWWFDIPMHIIGGVALGTLGLWFFGSCHARFGVFPQFSSIILLVLSFVFFVGVMWEVYENLVGYTFNTIGNYQLDVFKDLFMDMVGGSIVLYLYIRERKQHRTLHAE